MVKETLERVAESAGALARSFRDLSAARQAAVLAVAALLAGAASVLMGWGDDSYRPVLTEVPGDPGSAARLQALAAALTESGIPWREGRDPGGLRALEVPAERRVRALQLVDSSASPPGSASVASPIASVSFWEPRARIEEKQRDFNRRKIEQAIGLNRNIARADVVLSQATEGRYALDPSADDSASVTVHLHPGVHQLLPQEADAIRSMVSSAFNLKSDRVSITDDRLRSYDQRSGNALALDAAERWRKEIRDVIAEAYAKLFASEEFHVGVIVYLSPRQSSIVKEDVDPERSVTKPAVTTIEREECAARDGGASGGLMSPSSAASAGGERTVVYRETSEEVTRFGIEKTLTEIPPGTLEGVSVNVLLDLSAVERHLRKEGILRPPPGRDGDLSLAALPAADREALLKDFVARQEAALRSQLEPLAASTVKVMVHPFERREAEPVMEPSLAAAFPAPVAPGGESGGWWTAGLAAAAGLAALAGLLAAKKRRVKGLAGDLAGDWIAKEAIREGARARHATRATLAGGLLGSVGDAGAHVRERPEVAALVLRSWLAQDETGAREGAKT